MRFPMFNLLPYHAMAMGSPVLWWAISSLSRPRRQQDWILKGLGDSCAARRRKAVGGHGRRALGGAVQNPDHGWLLRLPRAHRSTGERSSPATQPLGTLAEKLRIVT
jgi:hypothetical protein